MPDKGNSVMYKVHRFCKSMIVDTETQKILELQKYRYSLSRSPQSKVTCILSLRNMNMFQAPKDLEKNLYHTERDVSTQSTAYDPK